MHDNHSCGCLHIVLVKSNECKDRLYFHRPTDQLTTSKIIVALISEWQQPAVSFQFQVVS